MCTHQEIRPPIPPFTRETAIQKVRLAEDEWNSRDPARVYGLHVRQSVAQSRRVSSRPDRNRPVPHTQMGKKKSTTV